MIKRSLCVTSDSYHIGDQVHAVGLRQAAIVHMLVLVQRYPQIR